MPFFRIRYDLFDGTFVGYHADSFNNLTDDARYAKLHRGSTDTATKWLEVVRKNFKFGWDEAEEDLGFSQEYRTQPCWKGCGYDQIRLSVEEAT